MKLFFLNTIFIILCFSGLRANKVTVLVDYTMTKGKIDGLKKNYPQIFKDVNDVVVIYLGSGNKLQPSNKYDIFKPSCKFDESIELANFLDNNNFSFNCIINLPVSCQEIQRDYALPLIENLSKQNKKDLKRSSSTLVIDLKGVSTMENPLLELYANNRLVESGEEVEFNVKISNIKSITNSRIEWIVNGNKIKIIEVLDETKNFTFKTDIQTISSVKSQLVINGCIYESPAIEISVIKCEFSVPYSLDFNSPLAFSTYEKYPNRHIVKPLNNSDQSKIILIKQRCFFKEFQLEVSNLNGDILNIVDYKINESNSREILQFLSIKDNNIKAIDIKEAVENYPTQELYIKVIPKNLNIPYNNLPKYEVFFKECQ
jgi:hypothetical protein